ncbi:MAG: hypothetical protein NTZ35_07325 [Ignavibacteriales bacterium]|nr:hypothetical protein [Ignavibacteriales bacterium]
MRLLRVLVLAVCCLAAVEAQISVAPPVVFLNSTNRFGTLTVENGTEVVQEVSVAFRFGYPTSDSLGKMSMRYDDSLEARRSSCAEWLRVFPKKFTLAPRQQQTVRIAASIPSGLSDRLFWTRCITTAAPRQQFVDTVQRGITTNVSFVFEQVTTVAFTAGSPRPAVEIEGKGVRSDSQSVAVLWHAHLRGNAPFFGTAVTKIFDARGHQVDEISETLAIYVDMMKRSEFKRSVLGQGSYTAEVTLLSKRNDIAPENIVQLQPITTRFTILIP